MALEPTPYFVGGGAEHSAEIMRTLAFAATSGSEGIVTPTDLKVTALNTPGTSVRVLSGAALILSRYAGADQQTYAIRNVSQTMVPVSPTGSSGGRSDLVVARVLDPQYEGQAPADPLTFQYSRLEIVQGVPSNTTTARGLGLGYPALALARIDIPASTATVTDSMITDLRTVAIPRMSPFLGFDYPTSRQELDAGSFQTLGEVTVPVPVWATHAVVLGHFSGMAVSFGDVEGHLAVTFAGSASASSEYTKFRAEAPDSTSSTRFTGLAATTMRLNSQAPGTDGVFRFRARETLSENNGVALVDAGSVLVAQIQFEERAV